MTVAGDEERPRGQSTLLARLLRTQSIGALTGRGAFPLPWPPLSQSPASATEAGTAVAPSSMRPSDQSRRGPGFHLRVNRAVPLEGPFGSSLSSEAAVRRPSARVPADCCTRGEAIVR
jgi:hypothetical protein